MNGRNQVPHVFTRLLLPSKTWVSSLVYSHISKRDLRTQSTDNSVLKRMQNPHSPIPNTEFCKFSLFQALTLPKNIFSNPIDFRLLFMLTKQGRDSEKRRDDAMTENTCKLHKPKILIKKSSKRRASPGRT